MIDLRNLLMDSADSKSTEQRYYRSRRERDKWNVSTPFLVESITYLYRKKKKKKTKTVSE